MPRSAAGATGLNMRSSRQEAAGAAAVFSVRSRFAGVTVLELVLVVALIGIMSVLATPFLSNSVSSRSLDLFSAQAVDALREAQFSAMNGKGAGRFGVHFETDRFVFFTGTVYSGSDPDNLEHPLDNGIAIDSISLSGGGADVHFASHRGVPMEYGTIIFSDGAGQIKTVTVGAAGMLDVD